MKILITGGCGFVGTNLALFLNSKGFKVTSLDNNSEVAIFEQTEKVNSELENKYKSDYCFTGSFWKYPRDIMSFLKPDNLPFEFALYGYNWEKFDKFKKYNRGPFPYTDMPQIYASTKIVIDDANSVTKQWGSTNSRVFDAIISGALVITNSELGNQESFDGLLPTYNSRESLENLLREYLTNEELRLAKVAELQKIVKEKHTYKHRAYTVFSTLPMKAGTKLDTLAVFKGQDPPVVKEREEYPDWVGRLAEPLPSLAKLRKMPNEEADDKDILRFLKLNRRIRIREQNDESSS